MNKLIIANWKCNPATLEEAKELLEKIKDNALGKNVVICPPSIFLSSLICEGVKFGAQNCFWKEKGAFTGETSPQMIKSIGADYVIIGHSERRNILKETNEEIVQKVIEAIKANLIPIVCVGESKGEDAFKVLGEQIKGIDEDIILAYEPLWAIGTGEYASIEKVKEVKEFLKERKVLYGGSVNAENIQQYLTVTDGVLIGGASLDFEEFNKILCDI